LVLHVWDGASLALLRHHAIVALSGGSQAASAAVDTAWRCDFDVDDISSDDGGVHTPKERDGLIFDN